MRPLDFLGRIKIKLGLAITLAVVAAFVVNEVGINNGVTRELRVAIAFLLALLMVQLLARGMIRPLREMAAAAQTIAKGRYGERVRATSRDEVGELARAFNAMAADLGAVDRQRRELVANVSHELRTPIAGLRAVLENVVDGVSPPDHGTLGTALAQTERLEKLVAQLLDLSRLDSGALPIEPECVALAPLFDQAVREAGLGRDDVRVRCLVRPALAVRADPALLAQVLSNLLDNAVRHSPSGGTVTLAAASDGGGGVRISVTDEGPGIPVAERSRVFDRFSRLDTARATHAGGTGLGLAIVKEIVELHAGSVRITDGPGCHLLVHLPERVPMSHPDDAGHPRSTPAGETGAVSGGSAVHDLDSVPEQAPPGKAPPGQALPDKAATGQSAPGPGPAPRTVAAEAAGADVPGGAEVPVEEGAAVRASAALDDGAALRVSAVVEGNGAREGGAALGRAAGPREGSRLEADTVVGSEPPLRRGDPAARDAARLREVSAPNGDSDLEDRDRPSPEPVASGAPSPVDAFPGAPSPVAAPPGAATAGRGEDGPGAHGGTGPPGGRGGHPGWGVPPHPAEPTRNWLAAFGLCIVGAGVGLGVGLVTGFIMAFTDMALGGLTALTITVIGAFAGTVIGATRPLNPSQAPAGLPADRPAHGGPVARPSRDGHPAPSRDGRPVPVYVPPPVFPRPDVPEMPRWALPAIGAVALLAAVALPYAQPGLGFVMVAVALGVAAFPAVWRRVTGWSAVLGLIGYALVTVPLFLDGEWIVGPLALAGFGIAALALSGAGRGWLGVLKGGASVLLSLIPVPWFLGGPLRALVRRRPRRIAHVVIGVCLALVAVVVFGALFASADPVFSAFVTDLLTAPEWAASLPLRVVVFAVFAVLTAAVVIAALRPVTEPAAPRVGMRVGRVTWLLPLAALNLLFAAFVAVQITVLFGGARRVLTTAGLTYADYARQGFFQLVVVSVFVLAIVALAAAVISVERGERWVLAGLLGMLCALTMVILASALHRINLYTDVYGLTRLRASVLATILWLGAVFTLVIAAGAVRLARRPGGWLPRTLVAVTGAALVAFAVWNPDLRVAETQLSVREVSRLDTEYLGDLGAEAVPALDRLPEPLRSCVLVEVVAANDLDRADGWNGWNLARRQARELLAGRPVLRDVRCPAPGDRLTG